MLEYRFKYNEFFLKLIGTSTELINYFVYNIIPLLKKENVHLFHFSWIYFCFYFKSFYSGQTSKTKYNTYYRTPLLILFSENLKNCS